MESAERCRASVLLIFDFASNSKLLNCLFNLRDYNGSSVRSFDYASGASLPARALAADPIET